MTELSYVLLGDVLRRVPRREVGARLLEVGVHASRLEDGVSVSAPEEPPRSAPVLVVCLGKLLLI